MPTVLDEATGLTREVPEAQYQRLRQELGAGLRDRLTRLVDGPQVRMRVWDAVDGTITKPMEEAMVRLLLREVVFRCSSCNYTSIREGEVVSHVTLTREKGQQHRRAKLLPMIGREMSEQCTGCGFTFRLQKQQGHKHLEMVREAGKAHSGAIEEVIMHRFSAMPGVVNILQSRVVAEVESTHSNGRGRGNR